MSAPRSIRVFLSSTFGDMQAERNELVGRVFPRLRQWLAPLGIDADGISTAVSVLGLERGIEGLHDKVTALNRLFVTFRNKP